MTIVTNSWTCPQIRVCNWKLFFLFLNQNICCGYSKEPSQWDGSFEHPKKIFKLRDKKIIAILRSKILQNWPYDQKGLMGSFKWFVELCNLQVWYYVHCDFIHTQAKYCWLSFKTKQKENNHQKQNSKCTNNNAGHCGVRSNKVKWLKKYIVDWSGYLIDQPVSYGSRHNKTFVGVSDIARLKPVSSATQTS